MDFSFVHVVVSGCEGVLHGKWHRAKKLVIPLQAIVAWREAASYEHVRSDDRCNVRRRRFASERQRHRRYVFDCWLHNGLQIRALQICHYLNGCVSHLDCSELRNFRIVSWRLGFLYLSSSLDGPPKCFWWISQPIPLSWCTAVWRVCHW